MFLATQFLDLVYCFTVIQSYRIKNWNKETGSHTHPGIYAHIHPHAYTRKSIWWGKCGLWGFVGKVVNL